MVEYTNHDELLLDIENVVFYIVEANAWTPPIGGLILGCPENSGVVNIPWTKRLTLIGAQDWVEDVTTDKPRT